MFFTIDVFIAMSVLLIGVFVFFAYYSYEVPKAQAVSYTSDIQGLFATTTIADLNPYALPYVKRYLEDHNITRKENTIFTQIAEFYYRYTKGCSYCLNESIVNFTTDISKKMITEQYAMKILLYPDPLAYDPYDPSTSLELFTWSGASSLSKTDENKAKTLFSSKTIVSGLYNDTEFYGPYIIEVRVWQ